MGTLCVCWHLLRSHRQLQTFETRVSVLQTGADIMPSDDEQVSAVIAVNFMPQQAQVLQPEDDWTGVVSTAKRRRLQNRLNQRAYRLFPSHQSSCSLSVCSSH